MAEVASRESTSEIGAELRQLASLLLATLEGRRKLVWWCLLAAATACMGIGVFACWELLRRGVGVWGINHSVAWGVAVVTFVFWIGIAHAGTFLSAILHLLHQPWRTAFSRLAEGATLLAVLCAAMFPLLHLGRPWLAFWMLPYPNTRGSLWVNFRSPLMWDFVAIATYFIISVLFFWLGLLPDLAALRDRASSPAVRRFYGRLSLGWHGGERLWTHWRQVYDLLAGLATALVISVHSIVSWDFAVSLVPGWHSTIYPPYFVVGAIFSGLAMVITLSLLGGRVFGFHRLVTVEDLEPVAKLLLAGSCFIGLVYAAEFFHAYYAGDPFETAVFQDRLFGWMVIPFLLTLVGVVLAPQLFWFGGCRRSVPALLFVSLAVNVGMWCERFVIVVGPLQIGFLPGTQSLYHPTWWELGPILGSLGLFAAGLLVLFRIVPPLPAAEWKWRLLEERLPNLWIREDSTL